MTGARTWVIAGGRIPLASTGREPDFTSRDCFSLLNVNETEARIHLTLYHADRPPSGPFVLKLGSGRMRRVRFNDLIDPEPLMLGEAYAAVLEASLPVVVQFTRVDTSQACLTTTGTLAFPASEN